MAREAESVRAERRALGSRLATFRQAEKLTQRQLAAKLHYERTSIAHIEAGRQPAPRTFWARADTVLNADGALLAAFDEFDRMRQHVADAAAERRHGEHAKQAEQWRTAGAAMPLIDSSTSGSHLLDATVWSWQHPVTHTDAVPDAGSPVLHWLVDQGAVDSAVRAKGWRRIGPSDVKRIQDVRERLKDLDNSLGGGAALPMALAYLQQEVPPLLSGQYDEKTGRSLVSAVAELTLDFGWMAYDAGIQPEARRQMLQVLQLAQYAGDRLFGGRVAAAMSHQALYLGRVSDAVDLAEAARTGTKQVASPTAVSMFSAMEACAFAAAHDQRSCFRALRVAEQAMERVRPDDEQPAWLDFDDGGVAGHAARAMCALGRPKEAQSFARYAITHCLPHHRRTRAQREALLATALYQDHDLEQAAAVGEQIVDEAWRLHSGHVRDEVMDLARLLRQAKSRTARRFVQHAQELSRAMPSSYSFKTT
jgi:transcriptional regulator with XRE-family HTH domain